MNKSPPGLVVVDGYDARVHVENYHLVVRDGAGTERRERRFHRDYSGRASGGIRRLIVIAHSGSVSLSALRWLRQAGAAFAHVDPYSGELIATSAPSATMIPQLRRAQAQAITTAAGVEVARFLIGEKISGHASLLGELPGGADVASVLQQAFARVKSASTIAELVGLEAQAAGAYWSAWAGVPVRFRSENRRRVPQHWRAFTRRFSPVTNTARRAADPLNATANYLSALLAGEATIALQIVGLYPSLGVIHADRQGRDSMALDAIEPIRPHLEAYLLALLTERVFRRSDFIEQDDGSVRLATPLARELAETAGAWRARIAPVAEQIAGILAEEAPDGPIEVAKPLTRSRYRAAWEGRKPDRKTHQPAGEALRLPNRCRGCGAELPSRRHRWCETCRREQFMTQADEARATAAQTLADLRAGGADPAHGGHAAQRRGARNREHQAAVRSWNGPPGDPEVFRREILPQLADVPIGRSATATGLSPHYCSLIRLGKRTPHPRWWEALKETAAETSTPQHPAADHPRRRPATT